MSDPSIRERLRQIAPAISVGMLTADTMALGGEIGILERAGVKILHFDVMDGCFCPMLTFGAPVVKGLKTSLFKDVHLMVQDPLEKLDPFIAAGADMITVHIEACRHPHRVLQVLRQATNANDPARGILRGIALNPGTQVEAAQPLLDEVDMVTLLAVNPGWGGQKFIPATRARMAALLDLVRASGRDVLVCVDGGVTRDNVDEIARMGADVIVTGSAVFDGKDVAANARGMLANVAAAHKAGGR
jgi:ribulose-phosphate 3-epimerase